MKMTSAELASLISRRTGSSFENCLSSINDVGAVDRFGTIRADTLDSLAGRFQMSNSSLSSVLSRATGRLIEDVARDVGSGATPMRMTYRSTWFSGK